MFARARPAGNGRSPKRAAFNAHIDLNCWIPARIQNFARMAVADAAARHRFLRRLEQLSGMQANRFGVGLVPRRWKEPVHDVEIPIGNFAETRIIFAMIRPVALATVALLAAISTTAAEEAQR